jgi:Kef-type K+ transport system membrane component KefB
MEVPNMSSNARSMTTDSHDWSLWRVVVGYGIVAIVFIGLIWAVLVYGQSLTPVVAIASSETAAKVDAAHKLSPLYHVLLALVSILLLGRWMGKLFAYFGQPRVIGEMVAGIMLGPSL